MYFPYLRGRQFELIALRELLEKRLIGDKIVPIIEPVKLTSTLVKTLNLYVEEKHKVALIMNPQVGNFVEMKKPHACTIKSTGKKANRWEITRLGADIKIKCSNCDHVVMMSRHDFEQKMKKVL